jgi:hypothetical protein
LPQVRLCLTIQLQAVTIRLYPRHCKQRPRNPHDRNGLLARQHHAAFIRERIRLSNVTRAIAILW